MLSAVFFCARQKAGGILRTMLCGSPAKSGFRIPPNEIPQKYATKFVVYSLKATKLVAYS